MAEKPRESLLVQVLEMHQHSGTASLPMSDEAKGAGPPWQLKSLLYGKDITPQQAFVGRCLQSSAAAQRERGPDPQGQATRTDSTSGKEG